MKQSLALVGLQAGSTGRKRPFPSGPTSTLFDPQSNKSDLHGLGPTESYKTAPVRISPAGSSPGGERVQS
jgi:hypothetical protein